MLMGRGDWSPADNQPKVIGGEGRMKAEHRKELETNTLADRIGGFVQGFKEGPSRNALIYGSLVCVALVLFVIYRWVATNATSADSARWLRTEEITTREDLESFAKDNAETEPGRLSRFQLARIDLVNGLSGLGSLSRGDALKAIRRAAESYEKLAGESGRSPLLAQEALFNAAKARESLGEYDQARQLYARLARDYPQSIKGKEAAEQAKALETVGPTLEELARLAKDNSGDSLSLPPSPIQP
jgi:tetratricopeptide (TPR) repeat protein